ncbi:MAG: antibiotic biosynthesis monooxygenase [Actinobacteria bacterium]|nr:antibiotic biosynthesis monooxygenase [Actinomycetota bacterium]
MSKVALAVKLPAAAGKGNELAAAMEEALDHVRQESGTRYYILHADTSNPDILWMYEMYDSQADLDAHMGADWFKQLGPKLAPLFGGAPEFHFLRPIAGKGL